MTQGTTTATADTATDSREMDVLLVGTFGGGGVHHYVKEQAERLSPHLEVETHDMGMSPVDVDALTAVIDDTVADAERRAQLAANNHAGVEEKYAWGRTVDELLGVYEIHAGRKRGIAQ